MGIQERAMLEYRRTMKKARGMAAVLGLCMAVAGTSVSYASASGNTGDSGYESSQEHTESAGADTGGSSGESFEAGDSLGGGSGGGSGGGGSPETGGDSGCSGADTESGISEAEGSSGGSGTEAEPGGSEAEDSADDKPAASSEETAFGAGQKENGQATGNVTGENSDQAPEAGIADGGKAAETSETPASPEIQKQLSIPESTVTSEPEAEPGSAAESEPEAAAGSAVTPEPEAAAAPAAESEPEAEPGSAVTPEPEVAAAPAAVQAAAPAAVQAAAPAALQVAAPAAVQAAAPAALQAAAPAALQAAAPAALQAAAPVAVQAAAPATVQAAALAADATSTDTAITITGCDKVKISVNEGKQLEIYLNDSAYKTTYTNTTGITNLSIRAKDKISFKNDLASGKNWLLDLSQAIVELIAKQIELKPNEQVTLKVKQLTLQADDSNDSGSAREVFSNVVKKVYDSDARYVGIRNMTIIADSGGGSSGSSTIVISASNTASSDADSTTAADGASADTSIWQNVDSGVASLGSFLANVKNMETIVEIEDSSLTADSIKMTSGNTLNMNTKGIGIGVAVNVGNASSVVLVKNSNLTSRTGNIELTAKSIINSTADAEAKAGNIAVGVAVVGGTSEVVVDGNGTITSAGNVMLIADSNAKAATNATGKKTSDNRSGAFAGVSVVNYDTRANIGGTVNVTSAGNVTVNSRQYGINGTTVKSVKSSENGTSENTSIQKILGIIHNSLDNIQLTSRLKSKADAAGNAVKTKVSSWFRKDEVEGKISESLNTAQEDSGIGSLFEEAEASIANKVDLKFVDRSTGKEVEGVTVKITPNEGTTGTNRLATTGKNGTYNGDGFTAGSYTLTIIVPSGYAVPEDQVFRIIGGKGFNGTYKLAKTSNTANQMVGAIAVTVVNSSNEASITTTGKIKAGGTVEVIANAVSNNTTVADASTIPSDLDRDADDNEFAFALVTEDNSTTLPTTATLTKLQGTSGDVEDTANKYSETLKDADGLISFKSGFTQNADGTISAGSQKLTAGRYKLEFKLPSSFGFKPKDSSITSRKITDEATRQEYNVYTMYITLTAKTAGGTDLKGLKQLITMTANGDTSGTSGTGTSAGVGAGVNVVNSSNLAYIENAHIEANGLTVSAKTGGYEESITKTENGQTTTVKTTYNNKSDVSSVAGFNSGNFGFGGAVSVNVVNDVTKAYISGASINIGNNGNITIKAESESDAGTSAGSTTSDDESAKSVGVGTAIAVSVVSHTTSAELGETALVKGNNSSGTIGSLTIDASSKGAIEASAIAGAAGGKAVVPVVAVNIVNTTTKARAARNANAANNIIALVGDLTVHAKSEKKRKTTANGKAAGSSAGFGGAITVAAGHMRQYAYMERKISSARNIQVTVESGNSSETVSIASANGAPANEDDSSGSDDSDPASKKTPDALVNNALAAGKKTGGGTGSITGTSSKTPQSAETADGKVMAAAAIAVDVWNDTTEAKVTADTTSTGKLTVEAKAANSVKVVSNASAALSKNGVGVSVAILAGNLLNRAIITGKHTSGSFEIHAGMRNDGDTNEISVISISGAGASNVGVAGAVAINLFDTAYLASAGYGNDTADLTAAGSGEVSAKVNQKVSTKAGASADLAGDGNTSGSGKSTGVGASFGLTIADASAEAVVSENSKIRTGGNFTVEALANSTVETYVQAGTDAFEEPAEDGKLTITVKDSTGKALSDVTVTVTADGKSADHKTNSDGQIEITTSGITKDTVYTVEIKAVPNGYKLPAAKDRKIKVTLTKDDTAFAKTFVLSKTNQSEKDKYTSLDAAVSVSLVSNKVRAEAEQGACVDAGGNLTLNAESVSAANTTAEGEAEASNAAVGASVAVNLVAETVTARMAGNGAVGGNLTVTARAKAQDLAKAYATASGLDLQRYKDKYNSSIADILSGKAFGTGSGTGSSSASGNNSGSGSSGTGTGSDNSKANDRLNGALKDSGDTTSNNASLSSKVLSAAGAKTDETTTVSTGSVGTTGNGAAGSSTAKKDAAAAGSTTKQENPVSVAAAAGVSIVSHDVTAEMTGTITKTKTVTIKAENLDNFEMLATGAAVSKKTSIALGVAVIVNNSKTRGALMGNLGTAGSRVGDITIQAVTKTNMDDNFRTKLGAEAIAGAGNGSEDGGAAVAGAVAVISSNAETTAEIGPNVTVYSDGEVTVEAIEQSRLAARAWGATLTSSTFDEQNNGGNGSGSSSSSGSSSGNGSSSGSSGAGKGSGAGVGASFAIIYAKNKTKAQVGDNARIYAKSLTVNAEKKAVNAAWINKDVEINGTISSGSKQLPGGKIYINTTDKAQSDNELTLSDLSSAAMDLLNLLSNQNYYLEAVGGSASTVGSSFTGAGSFTVLVMEDTVEALVGNNVVLVLTDGLKVTAASKVNAVVITGSVAYGGSKSAGVAISTIVNNMAVKAALGENVKAGGTVDANGNVTGNMTGDVIISADSDLGVTSVLVAGGVSSNRKSNGTSVAGDGVIQVFVSSNTTGAQIGNGTVIKTNGDIFVLAASTLKYTGITGGIAAGSGHGVGASVSVIVVNTRTAAAIGNNVQITAKNLAVSAIGKEKITAIIVNGAAAGSNGSAVAVSPAVNVIRTSTLAGVGTGTYNLTGSMKVTADDVTKILVISGGAAVSGGKAGVGGSVQVDVILKTVQALIADGTGGAYAAIYAPGGLTVKADSGEQLWLFVMGLGGGKSAAVSGSVGVVVISNQVEARIGSYTSVGNAGNRGNVSVTAADNMLTVVVAGGVAVSASSAAVGLSNIDVIADGTTKASLGDHAVIYGNNVTVKADSGKRFVNVAVSGGVSGASAAVTGSAVIAVVGDSIIALIEDNAKVQAAGTVSVMAEGATDIIDIVGSLGVGGNAFGASIDTIVYSGKVYAGIGKGTTVDAGGNVIVSAVSNDKLVDLVIGVGVGSSGAAVNGSVAVIVVKQNVFALIGTPGSDNSYADATGTVIRADGSIRVTAETIQELLSAAGSVAVSGSGAGVGAGVVVVTDSHRAWAEAGKNAVLDALGKTPVNGNFGSLNVSDVTIVTPGTNGNDVKTSYKKGSRGTMTINGVVIGAFNTSSIHILAVTAAGGSGAGVGAATATAVEQAKVQAIINSGAKINRTAARQGGSASVSVLALSDTVESVSGGSAAAGGTAGVSGAVVVYTGMKETTAKIADGVELYAENGLAVWARSENHIYANVIGAAAGGSAGVGATVSVIVLQDVTTASVGGSVTAGSITVKAEAYENLQLSATSAAGSGTVGVGAAVGTIVFKGTTLAQVRPGAALIATNGDILVYAGSEERVNMTVLGAGVSGSVGVSGSFAVLVMNVTTKALVENSSASNKGSLSAANGNVMVKAGDVTGLTLNTGGVAAGAAVGAGAAIETAVYRNTVTALIGNYNSVTARSILVQASADRTIRATAIMAGAGGSAAVNGSILVLSVGAMPVDQDADNANTGSSAGGSSTNANREASARGDAAVKYGYGQTVTTEQDNSYVTEVNGTLAGLSGQNQNLISGYLNSRSVEDKTFAGIGNNGSTTAAAGDVIVKATEKTTLDSTAGAAAAGGSASGGISLNLVILNATAEARLGGNVQAGAGNVRVIAENILNVDNMMAIGGGAAGSASMAGTITILKAGEQAKAYIAPNAVAAAGGNVILLADSSQKILVVNGSVSGAGAASLGVATNVLKIANKTQAYIGDGAQVTANANGSAEAGADGSISSSVKDGYSKNLNGSASTADMDYVSSTAGSSGMTGVLVNAKSAQQIRTWVISGSAAGSVAAAGSVNVVIFESSTAAWIGKNAVVIAGNMGDIRVIATDSTALQTVTGNVTASGAVSAGLASDTITFSKLTRAYVGAGASLSSGRNIVIRANSDETYLTAVVSAGAAAGAAAGAVNGAVSTMVIKNQTLAEVMSNSKLTADGSIAVWSEDSQTLYVIAGAAGAAISFTPGASVSGAAGVAVVRAENIVRAQVQKLAELTAYGNAGISFYTGTLDGSNGNRRRKRQMQEQSGVLIGAFNQNLLVTTAASASVGTGLSGSAATVTVIAKSIVQAKVESGAKINQNNREGVTKQSKVKVIAMDATEADAAAGGAAIGIAGAAGTVVVLHLTKTVEAVLEGTIYAPGGVEVTAVSDNNVFLATVSASAALAGGAGSASVLYIQNMVHSALGGNIEARGAEVLVQAQNRQYVDTGAASLAGGISAAGGSGASIIFKSKTTAELLSQTTVTAAGLTVTAQSEETITGAVAAAAGGSGAGAGSLLVIVANAETKALTGSSCTISLTGNLTVQAKDLVTISMTAGSVAAGGKAAGGAVAVLIFKNTVLAEIGGSNTIQAAGLTLTAESARKIKSYVVAGSAGGGAVSGSVLVLLVGSKTSTDADTALKNGNTDTASAAQTQVNAALKRSGEAGNSVPSVDVKGYFASAAADTTTARIGSGTTIILTGKAFIRAKETTDLTAVSGAVAAGGVGAGGSVAVIILNGTTQAEIQGTIQAADTVSVSAENTINGSSIQAKVGAAGLIGALGASVAYVDVTGTTGVLIGSGASITSGRNTTVRADLTVKVSPITSGASVGWAAVGLAASRLRVSGTTSILSVQGSSLTAENGNISLTALQTITSNPETTGASGGYAVSGAAALAFVDITGTVKAESYAKVTAKNGSFDLLAQLILNAKTKASGTAVAVGGGIGGAVAKLNVEPTVLSAVRGGTITAKKLSVKALYNAKNDSNYSSSGSVSAEALAGAAGLMAGVSGALADITLSGSSTALAENAVLDLTGNAEITAKTGGSVGGTVKGISVSGIAAVGGVKVNISNTFTTIAALRSATVNQVQNLLIHAGYDAAVSGKAEGTSGGFAVGAGAQDVNITENITTTAEAAGSKAASSETFAVTAQDTHKITAKATGWSLAGGASGGLTNIKVTITNTTTAGVDQSIVTAKNILVKSSTSIQKDSTATASAGAVGGSANSVSDETTVTNTTATVIGSTGSTAGNTSLTAREDVMFVAETDNRFDGYATAVAGAILAKGKATAKQTVKNTVKVTIYPATVRANSHDVTISVLAKDTTNQLKAMGGAGGVAAGSSVEAASDMTVTALVEFLNGTGGNHAVVSAPGRDILVNTRTDTTAKVFGQIKFTVDGLSFLSTDVKNKMNIASTVNLGAYTELSAGNDLSIAALIGSIYALASAYSETGSIINTQSRPTAEVNVTAKAWIRGAENVKLSAANLLSLVAATAENNNIYTKAYSYGFTAGGTGSVVSKAVNNTKLYGQIDILGDQSELHGKDIYVSASAPRESEVQYRKEAKYRAETVTEFVKQTVERITTTIEKVAEKVIKWLPWPFNKIVKWITKTVVKVIRWTEEILVEKVLQSKTEAKEEGSYTSSNNVTLNGDIYYGNNAPVSIIIDENGQITNPDVTWHVEDGKIVIDSFVSKTSGSLKLEALLGEIKGNVTVHNNNVITDLSIINRSLMHLVVKDLDLYAESDPEKSAYTLLCNDYSRFTMTDVVDSTGQPVINIASNRGADITLDGMISYYTAILNIIFNGDRGNVYLGKNGKLEVSELHIKNAASAGSRDRYFRAELYATEDENGTLKQPQLTIEALEDIFAEIGLVRYLEIQGTDAASAQAAADAKAAQASDVNRALLSSISGKNIRLKLDSPKLLVGVIVTDKENFQYTYTQTKTEKTALDIVASAVKDKTKYEGILYSRTEFHNDTGNWETRYYTDEACTNQYVIADGSHVETEYDTTGFGYYLKEQNEDGTWKYTGLDQAPEYVLDADGAYTNEAWILVGGNKQKVTVDETITFIQYLKPDGQGGYTTETERTFWIVSDQIRYEYHPGSSQSFDSIHYNETTKKYEVIKDGIILASYNSLYYDAADGTYYGVVETEEEVQRTESADKRNTLLFTYDKEGAYQTGDLTVDENLQILMPGGTLVLGGTIQAGDTADIQADTVTRKDGERTDVKADRILIQTSHGFGTESSRIRVEAGNGGFSTTTVNQGAVYVQAKGDLRIGSIASEKEVGLKTEGAVLALTGTETNIRAEALNIAAGGNVGSTETALRTDISGNLDITAEDTIWLNQRGEAKVKNMTAKKGHVHLTAGSIRNTAAGNAAAITAKDILLKTENGDIGSESRMLTLNQSGVLSGSAAGSMYLENISGDMKLGSLNAADRSWLKAKGSITGTDPVKAALTADQTKLTSTEGNIGTADSPLLTKVDSLKAEAANGSIWLDGTRSGRALEVTGVTAKNEAVLKAESFVSSTEGSAPDVTADHIRLTATEGSIGSVENAMKVKGTSLQAEAASEICLTVPEGGIRAERLEAPDHISLNVAGTLTAGSRADGSANIQTKSLEITADQIGEKSQNLTTEGVAAEAGSKAELMLNAKAAHGVYIRDNSNILKLKTVSSDHNDVLIRTSGALLNDLEDEAADANVTAKNIILEAESAGTGEKALTTNLVEDETLPADQNSLTVQTDGAMNIHDIGTEGTAAVKAESKRECVSVKADRNLAITGAKGTDVVLEAAGSLTAEELKATGKVSAMVENDIRIINNTGAAFKDLVSRKGGIDLVMNGNISIDHLAAPGLVNMTSTGQIQAAAEGTLKLGALKADDRIRLTASGDIVNGIPDQEDSVNVSAEEISLRADGNIGAKDKALLTETKNAALEAENIYLKNQGSLNLSKAEAAATMELEVSGNLTSAGTTVKADRLSVNADNADLKTRVNEMTGAVSGNLVLENEGSLSVKDRLQAGDTVEIRTAGGILDVSGSLEAKNTKLSGADQVRVRVTDQIGNLDVATSESETSGISLDMESSSEQQQFTLATPGSVKLTTAMEDEQIDLFGNRVKIAGGANNALLRFSRMPGSLFVLVPGGNNRIHVVTTMAETMIRTGTGNDTFILGGAVEDEEDMEYTFDYSGRNGGEAQSGMMGAGNQHKLDISTEGGENTWHLWMSGAPFYLEGGTGHDTFIRYTFNITDQNGNTRTFATTHYNISSKGGSITKIGFPSSGGNRGPVVSGSQGTWILTEAGTWQFEKQTGGLQTGWMFRGGRWWYFNEEGTMQTGWILSGGQWYYLLPGEGSMLTGWQWIDGAWYYFTPYDHAKYPAGRMYRGEHTPDGCFVDDSGRWIA